MPPKKAEAPKAKPAAADAKKPAAEAPKKPAADASKKAPAPSDANVKKAPAQNNNNNNKQPQDSGKKTFELSKDPEEAAIQVKMNAVEVEVQDNRSTIEKLKQQLDAHNKARDKVQAQKTKLIGELKEKNPNAKGAREKVKELRKKKDVLLKTKDDQREKVREMKENLGIRGSLKELKEDVLLANVEKEIKILENALHSSTVGGRTLAEEKRIMAEIQQKTAAKKQIGTFIEQHEREKVLDEELKKLNDELTAAIEESEKAGEGANGINDKIKEIGEVVYKHKQDGNKVWEEITELRKKNDKLNEQFKKLNEDRKVVREKNKAARDEEYKAKKAAQDEIYKKKREDYQKRKEAEQAAREEAELAIVPFSQEIDDCDVLIKYLEGFVKKPVAAVAAPAKEETASPSNARAAENAPEGFVLKKDNEDLTPIGRRAKQANKQPKAPKPVKDKEFKLSMDEFAKFESLSVSPPSKISDIEAVLTSLKEKKEHYQKRSEQKSKERLEAMQKAKADAAAAAAAATEEQKNEAAKTTTTAEPTAV